MQSTQLYGSPLKHSSSCSSSSSAFVPWDFLAPRSKSFPANVASGPTYVEERPQHFYLWISPPGIMRIMECIVVVLCFTIFTCVASTLVWEVQYGYSTGLGGFGASYYHSFPSPYSAKVTMMAMATMCFLMSSAILVASFSRADTFRGCRFYLLVVVVDSAMAALLGIIDIVYIISINPMSQSSQNVLYDPILMMCHNMFGGSGGVRPVRFPFYNQYLYHYCHMDPQEVVAMVCGFLAVLALAIAACFAQKTRGKIWRHGKLSIYWEKPFTHASRGQDIENWVKNVEGEPSATLEPTVFLASQHRENSTASSMANTDSVNSKGSNSKHVEMSQGDRIEASSTPSVVSKGKLAWNPPLRITGPTESQYETGYTSDGDSGTDLGRDQWLSLYPKITSDEQRQQYKKVFDSDRRTYKQLCAEMDDISTQLRRLEGVPEHKVWGEEYKQLKELKRTPTYQAQKRQCREVQQKLLHIKRMIKFYDAGYRPNYEQPGEIQEEHPYSARSGITRAGDL
ncbi:occludin-like [Scleropages formosus]|uniref:occludin-like n=1 Tax=Scleropages formosus TaxID=113540 RepID=UPI0008783FEE|nr:occludin-like [Scleropages formosus]XP_018586608.1 occludin-like [Scleropages formosus]